MYIQEIKTIQQSKRKICLSNGADFVLYKKEVYTYGLQEDMELSPELYERILTEILIPRAKKRAMYLLEKMDRSEQQLRSKLQDSGYPAEAVDAAISYVASYHYIDDERLACAYIRYYQDSRSRMRIVQDLLKKGISKDTIEACMEAEYTTDETDMIRALLAKKHYDSQTATREEQAKMYRFLMQRGFRSSDVSKVLSEAHY
jgi:regulatory protein